MTAVAAINNLGSRAYNPRGNLWVNDESTYGHKQLMKMGWSKGKGLGKNEDGIKENLSVKFRSTNSGLGYKDDAYANVMKTEYESILKNLSAVYSQNEACTVQKENNKHERKNCEQGSRVIGSRLRYPKLFFGKDVSKYSEKDMKSIFICSQPSKDNQEILEDSILPQKKESESELPEVVETHSSTLSISEYFAKKMKERKNNVLPKKAFNDHDHQQPALDPKVTKSEMLPISSKKSKKSKIKQEMSIKQESIENSNVQQTEAEVEVTRTADDLNLPIKKSSSKKRKMKTEINEVETNTAHSLDLQGEHIVSDYKKRKISEDLTCEDNVSDVCKKKRKAEICKNGNCSGDVSDVVAHNVNEDKISCHIELSSDAALRLKKKLKKHKERTMCMGEGELSAKNSQVTNGDLLPSSEENGLSGDNAIHLKKNKKSKKIKIKKLRSCLKSKSGSYSIKNVSFNESVCYRVIDSDIESIDCLSDAFSLVQNNLANEVFDAASEENTRSSENNEVVAVDKVKTESSDNNEVVVVAHKVKIESSDITSVCQEINSNDNKTCSDSSVEVSGAVSDSELKECCSLFSLPSRKSPHFNSWIECQRQAIKMDLYKSMLKRIKTHKILKSSNLLSIKGYGNWGFK